MNTRLWKSCCLTAVVVVGVSFTSGCTTNADIPAFEQEISSEGDDSGTLERDTYHRALLREDMRAMTISVRKLLVLDAQSEVSEEERHRQVMRELDNLEGTARVVQEDGEISNYSLLNPYLGSFLHDISMAREFALQSPPNYQPATWLIKSCLFCHKHI